VIDKTEEKVPCAYPSTTSDDMMSIVEFGVSGYVHDMQSSSGLREKLTQLISDIESEVMTSTGIRDVAADIWPTTVETDEGIVENFAWCEMGFRARYFYSHASP
jgi:hypothetical protein